MEENDVKKRLSKSDEIESAIFFCKMLVLAGKLNEMGKKELGEQIRVCGLLLDV